MPDAIRLSLLTFRAHATICSAMTSAFHEGKACDAVLRFIEKRETAMRQGLRCPDREGHDDPVELACQLNDTLFAFEHTGIEPFSGQIELGNHARSFFKPIEDELAAILPHTELFHLHVPVDATRGLKPRDIPKMRLAIVTWVQAVAPTLPLNTTGRLKSTEKNVSVPGVPFRMSLYRSNRLIPPGIPLIIYHGVSGDREKARRDRIEQGYNKKIGKLAAWKRNANARTVLIFEDNDIQLTNPQVVADAVLDIVARAAHRPDEIHLVTSCIDPWWVSPVLVDNTSLFEVGDYKWAWQIDPNTLSSLTGR